MALCIQNITLAASKLSIRPLQPTLRSKDCNTEEEAVSVALLIFIQSCCKHIAVPTYALNKNYVVHHAPMGHLGCAKPLPALINEAKVPGRLAAEKLPEKMPIPMPMTLCMD